MAKFTAADIAAARKDPRWGGWGYLGERDSMNPAMKARIDGILVDAANDQGWTPEELFQFCNSRPGRHFADDARSGRDVETLRRWYLNRKTIDSIMAEVR